jgi:hypothetical protein
MNYIVYKALRDNGYNGDEMDGLPSVPPPSKLSEFVLSFAWLYAFFSLLFALCGMPFLVCKILKDLLP